MSTRGTFSPSFLHSIIRSRYLELNTFVPFSHGVLQNKHTSNTIVHFPVLIASLHYNTVVKIQSRLVALRRCRPYMSTLRLCIFYSTRTRCLERKVEISEHRKRTKKLSAPRISASTLTLYKTLDKTICG